MTQQRPKLIQMLTVPLHDRSNLEAVVPAVQVLDARHAGYGVKPEYYGAVGSAVPWTLGQAPGEGFTPDVEAALTVSTASSRRPCGMPPRSPDPSFTRTGPHDRPRVDWPHGHPE